MMLELSTSPPEWWVKGKQPQFPTLITPETVKHTNKLEPLLCLYKRKERGKHTTALPKVVGRLVSTGTLPGLIPYGPYLFLVKILASDAFVVQLQFLLKHRRHGFMAMGQNPNRTPSEHPNPH